MMTEEELEIFNNDELREKIWNILKNSKNLNFITHFYTTNSRNDKPQKNDINKFYFYLKIPKSAMSRYTISELRENYLNLINEHTLNAIWNLNKIISSILRNYIDKIERKIKLKMKNELVIYQMTFEDLFFLKMILL